VILPQKLKRAKYERRDFSKERKHCFHRHLHLRLPLKTCKIDLQGPFSVALISLPALQPEEAQRLFSLDFLKSYRNLHLHDLFEASPETLARLDSDSSM